MKKLILLIFVSINVVVYAQNVSSNENMKSNEANMNYDSSTHENLTDGFLMKDGKMMMVNDGKFTMMKRNITLPDGTVVMTDGNYMKKGGTKMMLNEGDHLDMNGKVTPMNDSNSSNDNKNTNTNKSMNQSSDQNMNHMPDSTNNKSKY